VVRRSMVKVDERLCNGCGKCVVPCAEGAITIVDGKAKVLKEEMCDGLGFCIGICPTGALSIENREAIAFDENTARKQHPQEIVASCFKCERSEKESALFPVRIDGRSEWVCAKCIPQLIHG
jgi:MinD superfamily P-loop ATPase